MACGAEFVCRCHSATFICMRVIQTNKIYLISNKKSNQWSSICYIIGIIGILVIIVISNVYVLLESVKVKSKNKEIYCDISI